VFIADVIDAWVGVLEKPGETAGKIFNIGSGHPLSINALAEKAIAAYGLPRDGDTISHAPARPGEQRQVQADISLARKAFGWQPKTRFEDGLAATVRWDGGGNGANLSGTLVSGNLGGGA
jgi:UDP-glucose 4-epimerase